LEHLCRSLDTLDDAALLLDAMVPNGWEKPFDADVSMMSTAQG